MLKIKLGTDRDEHIIRTVREAAPDKVLRVDANAAWTAKRTLQMVDVLVECGVEYVEQPVPAHDIDGLRFVRERSNTPGDCRRVVCVSTATSPGSSVLWTASTSSFPNAADYGKR